MVGRKSDLMPYLLSPSLHPELPGFWKEGPPYQIENIYHIDSEHPPVHYNSYTLKPHSLPHMDAPGHIFADGASIDAFYNKGVSSYFYGKCSLVQLEDHSFESHPKLENTYYYEVSKEHLMHAIEWVRGDPSVPEKLLLSSTKAPLNKWEFHDPNYALTLTEEAAHWLTQDASFHFYGTSWKSADFQPFSTERPIHKILMQKQAVIFECLKLSRIPSGEYYLFSFPLPLKNASEAPVCPVLFTQEEMQGMVK